MHEARTKFGENCEQLFLFLGGEIALCFLCKHPKQIDRELRCWKVNNDASRLGIAVRAEPPERLRRKQSDDAAKVSRRKFVGGVGCRTCIPFIIDLAQLFALCFSLRLPVAIDMQLGLR